MAHRHRPLGDDPEVISKLSMGLRLTDTDETREFRRSRRLLDSYHGIRSNKLVWKSVDEERHICEVFWECIILESLA
jgi:hypothetical protein